MTKRTLDAVLFDLDGTLADSMASIADAVIETLAQHGHATTVDELMPLFGPSMPVVIQRVTGVDEAEADRLYAEVLPTYYERHMPGTPPIEGAAELLEDLAARLPLAIVTSKVERGARDLLEHLGWTDHFPVVVGRDSSAGIKPSPVPVLHALDELHVGPSQAAFVGDTEEDMIAARDAEVALRVGVTNIRSAEALRAAGATATCPDLPAVRALLLGVTDPAR